MASKRDASRPLAVRSPRPPGGLFVSPAAHHRRRRRVAALAALAAVVLLAAGILDTGGAFSPPLDPAADSAGHATGAYVALLSRMTGRGRLAALSAAAAEGRAIDRTLRRTPFIRVAGAQHREVALTFDDGPGPYTPAVLRVLRARHVPATFFEVGQMLRYFHASAAAQLAGGFVIGDHTENHPFMSRLAPDAQQTQIDDQIGSGRLYGVPYPRLFRPPYGSFNADTTKLLRRRRILNVVWTIDSEDYRQPGVPAVVANVLTKIRPGAIVLMHDAGGRRSQTVAALPVIVAKLRRRGYKLVTVPRLILDNPPPSSQRLPPGLRQGVG